MVLKYDLRKDHLNENGEQSIIIKYNATGEKSPMRLATGVYVRKDFFHNGVITDTSIPDAARHERQSQVNLVMKRVRDIIRDFQEEGIDQPQGKQVKTKYDDLYNKKEPVVDEETEVLEIKPAFAPLEAFDKFIEDNKSGKRRTDKGGIAGQGTINNYQTTLNLVKDFIKEKKYNLDTWNKVNYEFYLKFTDYLFDDLGHFDGNCGKHVKHLKTFLNWAVDEDIIPNKLYNKKWIKWTENEVDSLVLFPDELKVIAGLSDDKLKAVFNGPRTRDLFVVGALTCLRVSDLMKINNFINRVGDNFYLKLHDTKTQNANGNKIPNVGAAILKKHLDNGGMPVIHDVTLNKDLKHLGAYLKRHFIKYQDKYKKQGLIIQDWNTAFTKARRRRGKIVKYEQIDLSKCFTTHLMRRTGITSLLIAGMPIHEVMKISNHKTVGEIQKYEKVANQFIDRSADEAWAKVFN